MKHTRPDISGVPLAWRLPYTMGEPYRDIRPAGETVLAMVRSVPDLPEIFLERGVVCINGEEVPQIFWPYTRPKVGTFDSPIVVTLHLPPAGGGQQSSGKTAVTLVAALALVALTAGASTGLFAVGGFFAAGSTSASILAGSIGLAGSLALAALSAPPSVAAQAAASGENTDNREPASASGNVIAPGGAIPRVIGTRKVLPPFASEPFVELVDDDEYVSAVVVLNGPHELNDIRISGVALDEAADVQIETREGWADDDALTLVTRQARTIQPQIELSVHKVKPDAQTKLLDPTNPDVDLPVWHGVVSRNGPDEIWLHLLLAGGLSINGSTSTDVAVPLRVRARKRGDSTWINFPEVHLSDSTLQQRRRAIVFKWATAPEHLSDAPASGGFVYANIAVPGQASDPVTAGWTADAYFSSGSGNAYFYRGTEGATKVKNVVLFGNRVEFYLDEITFPKGIYEIEIRRGAAYKASDFTFSTYQHSGSVKSLFTYQSVSAPAIPMSRANLSDRVTVSRVVSFWDEHPIQKTGFALVALKARNRSIQDVSIIASGYVRDWDGSGWNTWTTTSNPAPHYADVLSGTQNIDPLPIDLRDDTGLVAWRTLCADNGWTCDAIIDDMRTQDVLGLLASCAYAKPYQSDIYGVTVDDDRSEDSPVQVFSRRNAANVRLERSFPRPPEGFIVNYRDAAADYDTTQTFVYQRDRSASTTGLLETVTYDGLVSEAAVEARAQFDLDQGNQRATFYYLDTDLEALVCRRGSLVGLQHDILSKRAGDALLKSKTVQGGNIVGLTLDSTIPILNEDDMHDVADMHEVADMHLVGLQTGIAIRRRDQTISTHAISNATGESSEITIETPITNTSEILGLDETDGSYGCSIVTGPLAVEYLRLLVAGITYRKEREATLVMVDEAPELVRYAA